LPDTIKNQAILAVKDEYSFGFLSLADQYSENELETALVNNIRAFLLEMNYQFAFVGIKKIVEFSRDLVEYGFVYIYK
jgi:predicted nuclease of restriction endonuclease-like (RecB) superfamily